MDGEKVELSNSRIIFATGFPQKRSQCWFTGSLNFDQKTVLMHNLETKFIPPAIYIQKFANCLFKCGLKRERGERRLAVLSVNVMRLPSVLSEQDIKLTA